MKQLIFCLHLVLIPQFTQAQDKHDYNWLLGQHTNSFFIQANHFDFNHDPMEIRPSALLGGLQQGTVMSDADGQLLFYSGGCYIANRNHEMMENGDSINAPGGPYYTNCSRDTSGYFLFQGIISLPVPGNKDLYYLFHLRKPQKNKEPDILCYSLVDMSYNNGLGKVIKKNITIAEGQFADAVTAVKHANGRDWWIVAPEDDDTYHILFLSPSGITHTIQEIGYNWSMGRWVNNAVFSPDGTKYARLGENNKLLYLCFDRCSGLFSCPILIQLDLFLGAAFGVAFSPNSQLLYVSYIEELFQFDTKNLSSNSKPVLIDRYDGFKLGFAANFFRMSLAPNGKIYMCCANGIAVMHVINAPDSVGTACRFEQHSIPLFGSNHIGINHFPNFRLYDQAASRCDTLGIDTPEHLPEPARWVPVEGMSIYPNPASDYFRLAVAACESGRLRIVNAEGRVMYEVSNWSGPQNIDIDATNWPGGVYFVHLFRYRFRVIHSVQKVLVVH
jgi:hypothetical protein